MIVERLPPEILADRQALEEHVARKIPFIIENAMPGGWTLERFLDAYGDHVVRVSSRSFYLPFSTEQCRVRDYVASLVEHPPARLSSSDEPVPYVFHDDLGHDAARQKSGATANPSSIAQLCPLPEAFGQIFFGKRLAAVRVGFGPRYSHAGLHTHGTAMNQLAFGSKRWFLYPAAMGEAQVSRIHAFMKCARVPSPQLLWFEHFHALGEGRDGDIVEAVRETAESLAAQGLLEIPASETWTPFPAEHVRGVEATQHAGDLVYVPERWPHAIINDAWSLAIIYELLRETRH